MKVEPRIASQVQALVSRAVAKQGAKLSLTPSAGLGASSPQPLWAHLQACEAALMASMANQRAEADGHTLEWGHLLYVLNNPSRFGLEDASHPGDSITQKLRSLQMPESEISDTTFDRVVADADASAIVTGDGSILSTTKWNALDPCWVLALLSYAYYRYFDPAAIAAFGTDPQVVPVTAAGDNLVLGLISDWGTGKWPDGSTTGPSSAVCEHLKRLSPDVVVHLGDTYYAGLEPEVSSNLVGSIQGLAGQMFTLNANHEMYDGGNGYFTTALAAGGPFGRQKGTSYFALTYGNSIIIGLDTAYYDRSKLYLDGYFGDQAQIHFLSTLDLADKTVIVLTHHNPITFDGTSKMEFYDEVTKALKVMPDYWYWGHQHDGIVYSGSSAAGSVKARCVGHGALPFGNASSLNPGGRGFIPSVTYYSHTPYPDPGVDQKDRVLNGFAVLDITVDGAVTETFYNQDGKVAWTSSPNGTGPAVAS